MRWIYPKLSKIQWKMHCLIHPKLHYTLPANVQQPLACHIGSLINIFFRPSGQALMAVMQVTLSMGLVGCLFNWPNGPLTSVDWTTWQVNLWAVGNPIWFPDEAKVGHRQGMMAQPGDASWFGQAEQVSMW